MAVNLDDAPALQALDAGGMLAHMDAYVDAFHSSFRNAAATSLKPPRDANGLLFLGMGGSGIGGEIAARVTGATRPVPAVVVKDYALPAWVNDRTLVVATSYSGQTEETLEAVHAAHERGATLATVSSGGALGAFAREHEAAHVAVPTGKPPRVALPELLGATMGLLHAVGWGPPAPSGRDDEAVRTVHRRVRPDAPLHANPAKQFAHALHDRFPVWFASTSLAPVAVRARCQLNENAKMVARDDVLPEANHNDLVAWNALDDASGYFVAFLREAEEHPQVQRRFDFFTSVLHRVGAGNGAFVAEAPTPLGRVLQSLLVVDYTSVYAAFLRGVDPTPVDVIGDLKRTLAPRRASP